MKVFLSWSGERSKKVAELLENWLQYVLQAVKPFMSQNIDRGTLWFSELYDQLANTGIGIVCLTKENKNKPWILFESGALAKGLTSNKVCTFLIDLKPTDLENPLAQFNHTLPTKDGVLSLIKTINLSLKEAALREDLLKDVFENYWPRFEQEFSACLKTAPETTILETRQQPEIMLDILSTVRTVEKHVRNIGSISVAPAVETILESIKGMANPELVDLMEVVKYLKNRGFTKSQMIIELGRLGYSKKKIYDSLETIESSINDSN